MKTRKFQLNKLVRDKVFENIIELGQKPEHKTLNQEDFIEALKNKLLEEAGEFNPAEPNAMKELADLLEVIEQLAKELGMDFDKLRELQAEIRAKRGGFEKRAYIGNLKVPTNDKWADYYASDPKRFPEVKN